MRRTTSCLLTAALLAAAGAAHATDKVKTQRVSLSAAGLSTVSIELSVGQVSVEACDSNDVFAEMTINCEMNRSNCAERAHDVNLTSKTEDGRLHLKVEGCPKFACGGLQIELSVKMPRSLDLSLDVGMGEAHVSGIEGDLDAEIGVGELRVSGPVDRIHSVEMESGVGNAKLDLPGPSPQASGFIGKQLSWYEGKGSADYALDVGVGDVKVVLR
jgi:hypothetical protein